jgi:long-chain fatty acid transport protein
VPSLDVDGICFLFFKWLLYIYGMKWGLLAGFLWPICAAAGGYQTNVQSVKALGMGHCGIGFTGDASALFFNPGQASSLQGRYGIQAGFTPLWANTLYQTPGSNYSVRTLPNMGTPFHLYAFSSFKKMPALKAGLAVYTPFGSRVQYPNDWKGQFLLREISLKSIFIQPTVSYQINKRWGIGGGLVFATGGFVLRKGIPLQGSNSEYGEGSLEGKGRGWGWQIGTHYKLDDQWQFGLTYRSLVQMKVNEGDAVFTVPASAASFFPSGKFSAQLPLPGSLNYGIAFTPNKKWLFQFDMQMVFWKAYDSLNINFAQETEKLNDIRSARNYKGASIYRLGGEYQWHKKSAVRVGAYFDQTPVQAGYLTPETPDAHKLGFTAGASYSINNNLHLDAAVLYINGQRRTDTNLETAFEGTYQSKAVCGALGIRWQASPKKTN